MSVSFTQASQFLGQFLSLWQIHPWHLLGFLKRAWQLPDCCMLELIEDCIQLPCPRLRWLPDHRGGILLHRVPVDRA